MKKIIENLTKTLNIFKLNYEMNNSNSEIEIKKLKNLDELIEINTKFKIYKQYKIGLITKNI